MRIVAGRFRGRTLSTPRDHAVRPTADRVRESVFNILAHGIDGFSIEDARVIDLFAGTGALGLEALSRGAAFCLFVEEAPEARALIRQNVEALHLTGTTRIFRRDAADLGPLRNMTGFELAFADPPYGKGLAQAALGSLAAGEWLRPGGVCVLEERAGTTLSVPAGYDLIDERSWGDTTVTFVRRRQSR
jgi:16S rRNA (guanine966-N2)-methyltransferase